jgi:hypothetical protein
MENTAAPVEAGAADICLYVWLTGKIMHPVINEGACAVVPEAVIMVHEIVVPVTDTVKSN